MLRIVYDKRVATRDRIAAFVALADRGWAKPAQLVDVTATVMPTLPPTGARCRRARVPPTSTRCAYNTRYPRTPAPYGATTMVSKHESYDEKRALIE
jgi:hypothetical protein